MSDPVMPTYGRADIAFTHGQGNYLIDETGRRYLDALSGLAVNTLGHAHPAVTRALQQQAASLLHTSNLYRIPQQEQLAAELVRLSGMDNIFFANSGAEANEAAIKIARLSGHHRNIDNPAIIVADDAFHGRTMATLTATGSPKVQAGFSPLVSGFLRVPFNDVQAIQQAADANPDICAILIEPIQGEGGIRTPDPDYLPRLRALCDANDWLLMLDEVQTGNGRTGKFFAYQHADILPDVVTTAKGLGNGVPIGACLARGKAAATFAPGNHGSTFGGNPLACAAAIAVLDTLRQDNLIDRAGQLGTTIMERLRDDLDGINHVREIRGKGLMIGIELTVPCADLVARAREAGLLLNVTADNVVRLLPPLTLADDEAEQLLQILVRLIRDYH